MAAHRLVRTVGERPVHEGARVRAGQRAERDRAAAAVDRERGVQERLDVEPAGDDVAARERGVERPGSELALEPVDRLRREERHRRELVLGAEVAVAHQPLVRPHLHLVGGLPAVVRTRSVGSVARRTAAPARPPASRSRSPPPSLTAGPADSAHARDPARPQPPRHVGRPRGRPTRLAHRRHGEKDVVLGLPRLLSQDPRAEVLRSRCRADGSPLGAALDTLAARARPPPGRGRAQLVPPGAARSSRTCRGRSRVRRTAISTSTGPWPIEAVVDEAWEVWRREVAHAREVVDGLDFGDTVLARRGAHRGARHPRPHGRGVRPASRPCRPAAGDASTGARAVAAPDSADFAVNTGAG